MKEKEVYALNVGDKISHKRYGVCTVRELIADFGPRIFPDTSEGRTLLYQDGAPAGAPLLEISFHLLAPKD